MYFRWTSIGEVKIFINSLNGIKLIILQLIREAYGDAFTVGIADFRLDKI
jgi:hypothetical protein